MEVFACWSGERSQALAAALRDWLPSVLQHVTVWMSTEDIAKGRQWGPDITEHLVSARFGIVCLTPENVSSRWLHFEAGALAVSVKDALAEGRMTPLLLGVDATQIGTPLNLFQTTELTRDDVERLVHDINEISEAPRLAALVEKTFEKWWPEFERTLQEIVALEVEAGPEIEETAPQGAFPAELLMSMRAQERTLLRLERTMSNALPIVTAGVAWPKGIGPTGPALVSSLGSTGFATPTGPTGFATNLVDQAGLLVEIEAVLRGAGIAPLGGTVRVDGDVEYKVGTMPNAEALAQLEATARQRGLRFYLRGPSDVYRVG